MKSTNRSSWAPRLGLALLVLGLAATGCVRLVAQVMGTDPGSRTKTIVERNVMVPMRDGVKLATDIYRPAAAGQYPVVLTRLPYGTDQVLFKEMSALFTRRGYIFIAQDTRGEFDSEGDWFPIIPEFDDGHDTVAWIAKQPWCSGKIGMWGGSYFGYTQLEAAPDNPDLTCMVPFVTTGNMHKIIFRNGALELVSLEGWMTMERNGQLKRAGQPANLKPNLTGYFNEPMRDALPLDFENIRKDPKVIAAGPEAWLHHPGDTEKLPPLYFNDLYAKVSAPSLLVAGWYDIFLGPQLDDFVNLRRLGQGEAKKTRIIIGPWVHGIPSSKEEGPLTGLKLFGSSFMDWYDYWLKGIPNGAADEAPVKIFVMGENVWRDEQEWPLARAVATEYFLHGGGRANTDAGDGRLGLEPPKDEPADAYDYDPKNPAPTRGGGFLGGGDIKPGAQDQGDVPRRPDVLVYMTEPLASGIEVTGPINLILYAASSARDTDWVAKLLDIDPKGKPRLLQVGIVRARYREGYQHPTPIEPGQVYEYQIDMWATSNLFLPGHRIALWITSSDFPQFDRNANAAGEGGPDNIVVAHQKIHHDSLRPSRIVLPVIPR